MTRPIEGRGDADGEADATMTGSDPEWPFQRLVERMQPGGRLRRRWPLTGGVSAEVTAIEIDLPDGQKRRLVVRRHGATDRAANARIARDEFTLLRIAERHGLPSPRPVFLDESSELFPSPLLVIEFIDGASEIDPAQRRAAIRQVAVALARIHAVPDSPALAFLSRADPTIGEPPAQLDDRLGEGRIRDGLAASGPLAHRNRATLLHGDYWPGNLLWRDGALAAVIDWEDARVGDPLVDLANSRLEMLWAFGPAAMRHFTGDYLSLSPIDTSDLPDWDLRAALRPCGKLGSWGLDPATERRMRTQHAAFVDQALDNLARR